jgi:hypothetical protein
MRKKTILVVVCAALLFLLTSSSHALDSEQGRVTLTDATASDGSSDPHQEDPWDRFESPADQENGDSGTGTVVAVIGGYIILSF